MELGVDTFDHADIYGNYQCEALFGAVMAQNPGLNKALKIVTKFGIRLLSDARPAHYIKHYDTSSKHIISSVESSLQNLNREQIDLLLIHRPDPLMNPEEVAQAFENLRKGGKVKEFGVSNFLPHQFDMLQSYLDFRLVTNQVEISAVALNNFDNGVLDHCIQHKIPPMAWSPLAGGSIFSAETQRYLTVKNVLHRLAKSHETSVDQVMYQWLLMHPANIIPVVGSGQIKRIESAVNSMNVSLTRQQWFEIWVASVGKNVH